MMVLSESATPAIDSETMDDIARTHPSRALVLNMSTARRRKSRGTSLPPTASSCLHRHRCFCIMIFFRGLLYCSVMIQPTLCLVRNARLQMTPPPVFHTMIHSSGSTPPSSSPPPSRPFSARSSNLPDNNPPSSMSSSSSSFSSSSSTSSLLPPTPFQPSNGGISSGPVPSTDTNDSNKKQNNDDDDNKDYNSTNNDQPRPYPPRRRGGGQQYRSRQDPQYQYQHGRNETLRSHEDRQRAQLEWMVRNTNNVLGQDSPAPGEMPLHLIKITCSLMEVWSHRAAAVEHSKAPHVIERLLQRLLQERNAGNDNVAIKTDNYNAVLEGWANSKEAGSAERAEEILLQMEQVHGLKPTCRSYNAVIKAYVKNGNRDVAANKVHELVMKMEATDDPNVMPNKRSYNLLLYSLANAPAKVTDAPQRAQAVLERMLARYRQQKKEVEERGEDYEEISKFDKVKPDLNSFNQVIGAWARGREPGYEVGMDSTYHTLLELSDELDVQPDTDTFNAVMGGWLKSDDPDALSKIQQTFNAMEECYKNGNKSARPDRVSINTLHVAFNKYRHAVQSTKLDHNERLLALEEKFAIRPTFLSQNILMESIIKSGRVDAPELVYSILTSMEEDFRRGQKDMKPDQCSYSSVISAYITYQREDSAEKTEDILQRMWDLHRHHGGQRPDVAVYNSVLNAYASMESPRALERVKELLRDMESGETEGFPKPNLVTYNTVIKAMRSGSKEDGAVFAEDILTTLENMGQREPNYLPDNYSFTSVITAYARSNSRKKAEKALEILKRMIEAHENGNENAIPTTYSFNAALNACAFVDGSEQEKVAAFEIAMKLNKLRLESPYDLRPDSTWYGTMLRACSSLLQPSERREIEVDRFFREACDMGCVGRLVTTQLKFAATPEQYLRLTEREVDDRLLLKELPKAWTCNAGDSWPVYNSHVLSSDQYRNSNN